MAQTRHAAGRSRLVGLAAVAWCLLATGVLPIARALAQTLNPVYLDDSTRTRDALAGLDALIAAGNMPEAVRTLQDLLDNEGQRVVEAPDDPDLFVDVRTRVMNFISVRPEVLAAYRDAQEPEARRMLDDGEVAEVEASRWCTRSGLEAALRLAQSDIEGGRFEAARLALVAGESHTDASDATLASAGASLSALVARYLPRDDVRALAARWAARAGRGVPDEAPITWPALASTPVFTPVVPQPALDVAQLDQRPQAAVRLAPDSARPDVPDEGDPRTTTMQLPWVMPAVVGDTVLVNDGEYLSAWDRFTLAMRWRLRPPVPESMRDSILYISAINSRQLLSQGLEDATFVTPADGYALAATGLARMGAREGDDRLHCVEIDSGRLVWSVDVDQLDPVLANSSIRGPALVDGTTVVVTVRTYQQFRRLQAVAMVGLDLHTGNARWIRPLASAGTLPYRRPTAVADLGIVDRGVVYRVDELGTISAIEAATGRVVWIRRMLSISGPDASGEPWAMSGPIVDGDSIIALSPDHRDILRLDRATGKIIGQRGADVVGWPRYLERCGDYLIAVCVDRIFAVPAREFETATAYPSPRLPPPVTGRIVVAGGQLLAPTGQGMVRIDPALPGRAFDDAQTLHAAQRGMLLAAESQLLLADNDRLRSFLVWPEALERLQAQVASHPDDPVPPLTLARLAARAGQWPLLVPNLDRCLDVLDRADAGAADDTRDDVFRLGLGLVRLARENTPDPDVPVPPEDIVAPLVQRLSRAARTPAQQVSAIMETGLQHERAGRPGDACATYQRILDEPALAGALWSEGVLSVRAGLEASRRVQALVGAHGIGLYDPFETSALLERQALGQNPTLAGLTNLATRYPASRAAPRVWLDLARTQQERGLQVEAIDSLRHAFECASALARAGVGGEGTALSESAGLLISALAEAGEPAWALRTLDVALGENRDLMPDLSADLRAAVDADRPAPADARAATTDPTPLDLGRLRDLLRERAADTPPLPATGPAVLDDPRVIAERRVATPLMGDPPTDGVVLLGDGSRRLEFWSVGPDGLTLAWDKEAVGLDPPVVVSIDSERVLLFTHSRGGAAIECLSRSTGDLLWRTPAFETLFEPDPDLQARLEAARADGPTILTPLDGMVRADDMLATHDASTLVLADRTGRVAAFDMRDGRSLWARRLELSQIHDLAVRATRLLVGGAFPHPVGPDSVQTMLGPALLCIESRTGQTVARHDDAAAPDDRLALGEVRWVRIAPSGLALAGLRLGVGAFDAQSGLGTWRCEGGATSNTLDAWLDQDRLWVLGADRGLRLLDLDAGSLRVGALPTQGRTGSRGRITLTRLQRSVILASGRGVVILDREGGLLGVDAIDRQDTLLTPAVGQNYVALLDSASRRGAAELTRRLSIVNTSSARELLAVDLRLPDVPIGVTLLDGHILISTRSGVVDLPTPPEEPAAP